METVAINKLNKNLLPYMLIAYSFFAFLSPLSYIFNICLIGLLIISVIILDDSDILCFIAFASYFMACLDIISRFLKILDLVMSIWLVKKLFYSIKFKNKKNITLIVSMLAFFIILLIYGLILSNGHLYKLWQSVGLLLIIVNFFMLGKINIKNLTFALCLGLIISSLLSITSYYCGILPVAPFILDNNCGFRFSAYFNYVNALAFYCSLAQTCVLTLILSKQLNIKKWFWLPLVVTTIGLLTFSKSFILITTLTYILFVILGFIKSNNKKIYLKLIIVGSVIIGVLILIFNNYVSSIVKRFYANSSYEGLLNIITTGRLDIWKSYIKHCVSSPLYLLFGSGITANSVGMYTPHNLFISILYRFGIVGIAVLVACLIFIFKNISIKKFSCWYLPLIIVLINACFEDITSSLFTCLPILIALCFVLSYNKNDTHNI